MIQRRVRHVVTENARVLEAVDCCEPAASPIWRLSDASHASMRDDFEITVPQVDLAVEVARAAGALGARMTGGGFGGCIIALVPAGEVERVGARSPLRRRGIPSAHALRSPSVRGRPPPPVSRTNRFDRIPNRPASIKLRSRGRISLSSGPIRRYRAVKRDQPRPRRTLDWKEQHL